MRWEQEGGVLEGGSDAAATDVGAMLGEDGYFGDWDDGGVV